jgi:tRNA threonylcarbamoyladenosine biosynthesis protein TsaE
MSAWSFVSSSEKQTGGCGEKLARLLQGGEIIGLKGELGTGKTCFVRGVAGGLGVGRSAWVRSPTFTLINEYHGRLPVYHIDLYRVSQRAEQETLDLRDYLYGDGVSLIEWFEYLALEEVGEHLEVQFSHAGAKRRALTFIAHGAKYERIVGELKLQKFERRMELES